MKIYDVHIHAMNTEVCPEKLIERFEETGIYGGCVFSNWPERANKKKGTSFDERLNEVLNWTKDYKDRLFPVMWIHPYEKNIISNIEKAVKAGIAGFKIICTDFFVCEKRSMKVLKKIAELNKPVFFHSGILWDGEVSSAFNRPLNWEDLLKIKNLRFAMGHCSWPWIDECIALYGKFLNAGLENETAEMFFDITPGTPEIYRKELLYKLFSIGYDVSDNIMFGCDSLAHDYKSGWASGWLKTDGSIMDELGINEEQRKKIYQDNLMRFLGKTTLCRKKNLPTSDGRK